MIELVNGIEPLIMAELERANRKFPLFASDHEGYAVTLEELCETIDEVKMMSWDMEKIWEKIRHDSEVDENLLRKLEEHATLCSAESIQVAAMVRKFRRSREER